MLTEVMLGNPAIERIRGQLDLALQESKIFPRDDKVQKSTHVTNTAVAT